MRYSNREIKRLNNQGIQVAPQRATRTRCWLCKESTLRKFLTPTICSDENSHLLCDICRGWVMDGKEEKRREHLKEIVQ